MLEVRNFPSNGHRISDFINEKWYTISFKHHLDKNRNYSGMVDVYVNGSYKKTVDVGSVYTGLQTLVFSSAHTNWENNGAWYIDGIHRGDTMIYNN